MKGSEKQVKWAMDIISSTLEGLDQLVEVFKEERAAWEEKLANADTAPDPAKRVKRCNKAFAEIAENLTTIEVVRERLQKADDARVIIDERFLLGRYTPMGQQKDIAQALYNLRCVKSGKSQF